MSDYVNDVEKRLLERWYGVHTRDRKSWNAEPLNYDIWYIQDGQRLLLDYYRELEAERRQLQAVAQAARVVSADAAALKHLESNLSGDPVIDSNSWDAAYTLLYTDNRKLEAALKALEGHE